MIVTSLSDVLGRHKALHAITKSESSAGSTNRAAGSRARACTECVKARTRCTGGLACLRCMTRNLECRIPSSNGHDLRASRRTSVLSVQTSSTSEQGNRLGDLEPRANPLEASYSQDSIDLEASVPQITTITSMIRSSG